jgi:hypothetical protein
MTVSVQGILAAARNQFTDTFRRDGFGVVRGAISAGDTARLRAELSRLLSAGQQFAADQLEVAVPRIVERHSGFVALATAPPLISGSPT